MKQFYEIIKTKLFLVTLLISVNISFAQWDSIPSGTTNNLWDVHFPSANIGYAVGWNDTVLKTIDGGKTWITQNALLGFRYYGVYFKDDLNGYAVGRREFDNGVLHYTNDGGENWFGKPLGFQDLLWNSIAFSEYDINDVQHGIMVGQGGQIGYSPDSGETWYKRTSPAGTAGHVNDVTFLDGLNAVAVGYSSSGVGFIIKTTDGGNTWQNIITDAASRLISVSFFRNKFEGDRWEGLAVGGSGVIYRTIDGGDTWELQAQTETLNPLNGVHYYNEEYAVAVGNAGELYISKNGGVDWKAEPSDTSWNLNSVYVNARSSAVAVGSLGNLIRETCADAGGTLKFVDNTSAPFISPKLYTGSKAYFYYYVEQNENTPPLCAVVEEEVIMNGELVNIGVRYLGNGLAQFWIDFSKYYVTDPTYIIQLPTKLSEGGITIAFENPPPSFIVTLENTWSAQDVDIFAGRSSAKKIIKQKNYVAGSAWTEATISSTVSGGMGINLKLDLAGNEKVTRRLQGKISLGAKFPPAYQLKQRIDGEKKATVVLNGQVGQSLTFPATNGELDETARKAKTAFLLETFGLGAIPMSPVAGVVILALEKSLEILNPDIPDLYSKNYRNSLQYGFGVQGDLSLGYKLNFSDSPFEFLNGSSSLSLAGSYLHIDDFSNDNKTDQYDLAASFDIGLLNFKIGEKIDFGNAMSKKNGMKIGLTATKDVNNNIKEMKLSYEVSEQNTMKLIERTETDKYDFIFSKKVIDNNSNAANFVGVSAEILTKLKSNYPFKFGAEYFTNSLSELYVINPNSLDKFEDHNLFETRHAETIGISEKGVTESIFKFLKGGKGRIFGLELAFQQKEEYLKKQEFVLNDTILPTLENVKVDHNDYQLVGEIIQLIEGTVLLIQGALEELVIVLKQVFEDGIDFIVETVDGSVKLFGNIVSEGTQWVILKLDPTYKTSFNKMADFKTEVRQAYVSRTISNSKGVISKSAVVIPGEETLYIISDNVNVNLLDINDNPIETFDPVSLSITIDQAKVDELEFTDTEKALAKMYLYDEINLAWEEVVGDDNADINIVETQITKAGNYAIGIAYDTASDTSAPDIQDYYPKEGNIIPPSDQHWATLYEPITGAGIDLSQTIIKLDGVEVAASWDPVNDKILYTPETPLADGAHTFEVIVKDLNGNTNSIFSNFTVDSALSTKDILDIDAFKVYPNPAKDILHIKGNLSLLSSVNVYNTLGQHILTINRDFEDVNILGLKTGLYYFKLNTDQGTRIIKILKH